MNKIEALQRQFGARASITAEHLATFKIIQNEMIIKGEMGYRVIIEYDGNMCLACAGIDWEERRIDIGKVIFPVTRRGERLPTQIIPVMTEWLCIVATI